MNRNRRNQRQTQKVFYVMPPSDEGGGFLRSKKTEGARDEWNYRALPFSLGRFCKYLLSDVSRPMAPSVTFGDSSLPEGAFLFLCIIFSAVASHRPTSKSHQTGRGGVNVCEANLTPRGAKHIAPPDIASKLHRRVRLRTFAKQTLSVSS